MQKCLAAIFTLILVVLIGSYFYFDHYYSREATAERFIVAIEKNDARTVASIVRTDDADLKITPRSVQPLITYYQNHPNQRAKLKRQMTSTGIVNDHLDFVDSGHHFFLFEKYLLETKAVFPTIKSSQDNVQVKVNGKVVARSLNRNVTRTFGPYIPGRYKVELTVYRHHHTKKITRTVDWLNPTKTDLRIREIR